jgi:uncharacterized protein YqgC (DUF456 family)
MTTAEIIGLALALFVMLIGFVGSLVPGVPGPPLVLVAAVVHRLYFGEHSVRLLVLLCLILLTIFSIVLDFVASMFGAKRLGATWKGAVGAVVGGLIGMFFWIPGMIVGPFVGAMVMEMIGGHEFKKASKAGAGAVLGLILGIIVKCAVCVAMMALFTLDVILRSVN